jgi:hypothetical protein
VNLYLARFEIHYKEYGSSGGVRRWDSNEIRIVEAATVEDAIDKLNKAFSTDNGPFSDSASVENVEIFPCIR